MLKEGIMLERIMDLNILLYCMAALGAMGAIGMLATHLTYRRKLRQKGGIGNPKEKWMNLWKTKDKLLRRMNRLVWYPVLCSAIFFILSSIFGTMVSPEGLPARYLYVAVGVPLGLLAVRQALDISCMDGMLTDLLADYIERMRAWVEDVPAPKKTDPVLQEQMVEQIVGSIRQTAAAGSHFSKMLSPEEEEIMREIIREFMN